ncbi:hypothetical protein THRCLA_01631 [Thraustotheca clavata]|uniref:FUZ/MON1/HPS1 first Longin domain-containing protein n=1 Tax=Thraustotheca clavata TaxID=74557 RepID=A0A1W0A8J6_9STRA|nr:hypothetical protein THRCLA_01631 [Thraustotheca clavata]
MLPEVHVLSTAGKPIFSSSSDDNSHITKAGLIQGISSFSKDTLRVIRTKSIILHFLPCPPLLFFCAIPTSHQGLNVARLMYLIKNCFLFFLTQKGLKLVESNPNYDLRNLLHGTEGLLASLTKEWISTLWAQIDGIGVRHWPMTELARNHLNQSLDCPGLLYGLILRDDHIMAYRQGHKHHPLPIDDIHVLSHVVRHMPSFRSSESWTPICLPSFNSTGFLYAYIVYTALDICTILVSTAESQQQFHTFQHYHHEIISRALIQVLSQNPPAVLSAPPSLSNFLLEKHSPFVLYCLYQNAKTHQTIYPSFTESMAFQDKSHIFQLLKHFGSLHSQLHGPKPRLEMKKLAVPSVKDAHQQATNYFFRTDTMLFMGRVLERQSGFIYICCESLVTAEDADQILDYILARIYQFWLTPLV